MYFPDYKKVIKICEDKITYETTETLSVDMDIVTKYKPINILEIIYEDNIKRIVRYQYELSILKYNKS